MRVLVVGAQGFVGRRLVEHLCAAGHSVVGVSSRDGTGLDAQTGLPAPGFQVPPGTGAVVYLAASRWKRGGPVPNLLAVNVLSAVTVAELARRVGVGRFVYASSGSVYAPGFEAAKESSPLRRDDWYALSKVQAEEALALCRGAMGVTNARLFGVYGPGQRGRLVANLVECVRYGRAIVLHPRAGEGRSTSGLRVSLGYLDDVVTVLARLATEGGPDVLNVAGGEVVGLREIAEAIGRRLGVAPVFETSSTPRAFDLVADIDLLRRTLAPRLTAFEVGLARTVSEQCSEGG
jgi:nucleoside-diphosphate-sugar epimerase